MKVLVSVDGWVGRDKQSSPREFPEGSGTPLFRDGTVRAYEADAQELTIDFVVHEHGVAGVWARDAKPGDELGVLGPRGNVLFPENCARYMAAGDETALRELDIQVDESIFGYAAGDATALKSIRRYLRRELGLSKEQVDVDGYWKKGTANLDHRTDKLAEDGD